MTAEEYNISVNQIGPALLRFVKSNLYEMDASKDVVQDAFLVMWNKRETVDIKKAKSFLFSVAHHKMMDLFRSKKNMVGNLSVEHIADDQYRHYSEKDLVKKALGQLTFEYKELVTLRDLEGYDYKEIGQITGLSESKVKVYLFRARKALKKIITELEAIHERQN